ncbi:hypothetical protein BDZ45DRAFT_284990 [Acephala macrosclerotiorum]|nr:hypothetical protein BDZ45DRAFT_284990 [Acephala macrosclerotiorum]
MTSDIHRYLFATSNSFIGSLSYDISLSNVKQHLLETIKPLASTLSTFNFKHLPTLHRILPGFASIYLKPLLLSKFNSSTLITNYSASRNETPQPQLSSPTHHHPASLDSNHHPHRRHAAHPPSHPLHSPHNHHRITNTTHHTQSQHPLRPLRALMPLSIPSLLQRWILQ